ncbi:hypothetical protein DMA11_07800 [Marinilabiliaceae bacterium JC017]|nr:hypothetical protein DMA11_07800 [Marinilabiliaceae bacterium JC017]
MNKVFPENWLTVKLGDITTKPQYGWTTKSATNGQIKYVRTTDLSKGDIEWDKVPFCIDAPGEIEKYKLYENDILISRAGSVGLSYRVTNVIENAVFASYLIRFRSILNEPRYIEYFLNSPLYWRFVNSNSAGIAVQNINATKLSQIPIPLPPLNEQKRIADKLDQAFEYIDSVKARMDKIPELLKELREKNIQLAVNDSGISKWITLGDIDIKIQTGPFGSALHKHDYIENGIGIVNPIHIKGGKIYPSKDVSISKEKYDELSKYSLQIGDVILGRRGEMGRAANVESEGMICGTGCLVLRRNNSFDSKYLTYVLRSSQSVDHLTNNSVGSTMVNLNQKILKSLKVPQLDIKTQQRIVQKIESFITYIDSVEKKLKSLKEKLDDLPQQLLTKAFRGDLVPQDPNDEPAEVLLEEIKAEIENLKPTKRKPK